MGTSPGMTLCWAPACASGRGLVGTLELRMGPGRPVLGRELGIESPQETAKADQALALRGLRPLPGWDELPASCFGVIYRAAIYIVSISAAVWGRCEEARGEGLRLPRPQCPDVGCPAPSARGAAGSVGASLAVGRAQLGTRAGPSPALGALTLQEELCI